MSDYKDAYADGVQTGIDLYKRQLDAVDIVLGFPDGSGRARVEMIQDKIEPLRHSDDPEQADALRVNKPEGYVLYDYGAWEAEQQLHHTQKQRLRDAERKLYEMRKQVAALPCMTYGSHSLWLERDDVLAAIDAVMKGD